MVQYLFLTLRIDSEECGSKKRKRNISDKPSTSLGSHLHNESDRTPGDDWGGLGDVLLSNEYGFDENSGDVDSSSSQSGAAEGPSSSPNIQVTFQTQNSSKFIETYMPLSPKYRTRLTPRKTKVKCTTYFILF